MSKIAQIDSHLFEFVSRFCGLALPFNGVVIDRLPNRPGALVIGSDGDRMLVGYDRDSQLPGNPIQVAANNSLLVSAAKHRTNDKSSDIAIQPSEFGGVQATVTRTSFQGRITKSDFEINVTVPLFKWRTYLRKQSIPASQLPVSASLPASLCSVANDDGEMTGSKKNCLQAFSGKNGPTMIRFPGFSKLFAVLVPMDAPAENRFPAGLDNASNRAGFPG